MNTWEKFCGVLAVCCSVLMFGIGYDTGKTAERKWPTPEPHVETCELPLPPR